MNNTGATDSFVDPTIIPSTIQSEHMTCPRELLLFDGRSAGRVSQTVRLLLDVGFPIFLTHTFLVYALPTDTPLVLGLDFLQAHKPQVNWATLTLLPPKATSTHPAHLRALLPASDTGLMSDFVDPDEAPDDIAEILDVVPKEYHSFRRILESKGGAATASPLI